MSASRPGPSLPPEDTRYPLYRRLCGPQGRSGQVRKISPTPGFDPQTVQPVASRYTDCATRPVYWIPKATNTHSHYAILIAFPLQQWLRERTSMLRYTYTSFLVTFTCRHVTAVLNLNTFKLATITCKSKQGFPTYP